METSSFELNEKNNLDLEHDGDSGAKGQVEFYTDTNKHRSCAMCCGARDHLLTCQRMAVQDLKPSKIADSLLTVIESSNET